MSVCRATCHTAHCMNRVLVMLGGWQSDELQSQSFGTHFRSQSLTRNVVSLKCSVMTRIFVRLFVRKCDFPFS